MFKLFGALFISVFSIMGCGKEATTSVDRPDNKITPVQSKSAGKFSGGPGSAFQRRLLALLILFKSAVSGGRSIRRYVRLNFGYRRPI